MRDTSSKIVATLDIGPFYANGTILKCPECEMSYHSEELKSLVPYKCKFGFDVIVHVGKALFTHFHGVNEIMLELSSRNVEISNREISFLGKKFIIYLALAHRESSEQLRKYMDQQGGYVLQSDGTVEGNSPHLFSGLDGISEIVLANAKLPSEKADLLIPFFQKIKQQYGTPIACVHDMGKGILSAIEKVFPGIPDYICHTHFLKDIGKDLMKETYSKILNRLKAHRIRSKLREKLKAFMKLIDENGNAVDEFKKSMDNGKIFSSYYAEVPAITACILINWALDESHLDGYGFPFDRKHYDLYIRVTEIYKAIGQIMGINLYGELKNNKPFLKLRATLKTVLDDKSLQKYSLIMKEEIEVFEKIREALKIAPKEGKKGLNDGDDDVDMKTIEEKVQAFRKWLTTEKRFRCKKKYINMVKQIDKYWEKLFREPILLDTKNGEITMQPQRTNNLLEQFFRFEKRGYRKRTGTSNLSKTLKAMLADTPLVKNIDNDEYLKILLKGCNSLEERFAQIDSKFVVEELKKSKKEFEKLPLNMRKMIQESDLPKRISTMFANHER